MTIPQTPSNHNEIDDLDVVKIAREYFPYERNYVFNALRARELLELMDAEREAAEREADAQDRRRNHTPRSPAPREYVLPDWP